MGRDAHRHRASLESAVALSATRYRLGDVFDVHDLEDTAALPRHAAGRRVVEAVEALQTGAVGVPAVVVDTSTPTTIGLGDSFVGGFLAPLAGPRNR